MEKEHKREYTFGHKYVCPDGTESEEYKEKIITYPSKVKQILDRDPTYRVITVGNLPQYYEDIDPSLIVDVTDHVKLYGESFRYVQGLTKTEKETAIARTRNNVCPSMVARFPFRKKVRWYWIYARYSKENRRYKDHVAGEYTRVRIRATPISSKEVKDYLDKKYPLVKKTRKYIAPRIIPEWYIKWGAPGEWWETGEGDKVDQ